MFKYILVPSTGAATDDVVFRTALAIARPTAAHLAFLHVRKDMQEALLSVAGGDLGGTGYGGVIDTMQHEVESREARAHGGVAAFCGREQVSLAVTAPTGGISATWNVDAGEEPQCLAAHGRTADLTVLGREREGEKVAMHLMETVLLDSGRPLLLAPERPRDTIGRHIAIAWKDTAEAARAVAAALHLLAQADTVTILAVQETSDTQADSDSGKRLRDSLRWHNPATTLRVLPRSSREPVEALLSVVEEEGADLLVMGGYSHSRMREAMFGGFTRRVLRAAALPVLMAH